MWAYSSPTPGTRGARDYDYRIADVVTGPCFGPFIPRIKISAAYPKSLAAAFVNETGYVCQSQEDKGTNKRLPSWKVDILDKVLSQRCSDENIETVVHLRSGDALCQPDRFSVELRPRYDVETVVKKILSIHNSGRCILLYSAHGGCEAETEALVANISLTFAKLTKNKQVCETEEGLGWQDADRHLCRMVTASLFIQGNGGYSRLAERVRIRRGLPTFRDLT